MPFLSSSACRKARIAVERFSAADVLYATSFALFAKSPVLPKSPVIEEYVQRVLARPAYARAMAREGA